MENKFLMGSNDYLTRNSININKETRVSKELKINLLKVCIKEGFYFYETFFQKPPSKLDWNNLVKNYLDDLEEARSFGLFQTGGVREKDHLNFWCLGKALSPKLYIESGIFIGSSLHAFLKTQSLEKIIAIDPDLKKLRIPKQDMPKVELIDKQDFSQLEIKNIPDTSLVYFDDHINSANRIIQAKEKGLKYLLFDDSTGFEGICQRLYPAIPTIPMIVNHEILQQNDIIEWTWSRPESSGSKLKKFIKKTLGSNSNDVYTRVQLKLDHTIIEQCKLANALIKRYKKIPDFGEFIPQKFPEKMVDTSKYIVELID